MKAKHRDLLNIKAKLGLIAEKILADAETCEAVEDVLIAEAERVRLERDADIQGHLQSGVPSDVAHANTCFKTGKVDGLLEAVAILTDAKRLESMRDQANEDIEHQQEE